VGGVIGEELGDWAIWSVVEQSAKEIGIEHFGAHDLRRTCAKLCRKTGGDLEQIKFLLGHSSQLFLQALAGHRNLLGENHPDTIAIAKSLKIAEDAAAKWERKGQG
jgi:integrase